MHVFKANILHNCQVKKNKEQYTSQLLQKVQWYTIIFLKTFSKPKQ